MKLIQDKCYSDIQNYLYMILNKEKQNFNELLDIVNYCSNDSYWISSQGHSALDFLEHMCQKNLNMVKTSKYIFLSPILLKNNINVLKFFINFCEMKHLEYNESDIFRIFNLCLYGKSFYGDITFSGILAKINFDTIKFFFDSIGFREILDKWIKQINMGHKITIIIDYVSRFLKNNNNSLENFIYFINFIDVDLYKYVFHNRYLFEMLGIYLDTIEKFDYFYKRFNIRINPNELNKYIKNYEIVKFIVYNDMITKLNSIKNKIFLEACINNDIDMAKFIVKKYGHIGRKIHKKIKSGGIEIKNLELLEWIQNGCIIINIKSSNSLDIYQST